MVIACIHVLSSIHPSIHHQHHHHHHQMVRYYKNDNRPFKWLWEIIASMEEKRPSEEEDEDAVAAAAKEEEDAKGWSDRRWRGRGGCGGGVTLEGFVLGAAGNGQGGKTRRSLTDEDLEELKGCLDLGFGFSYEEIPELRNTLPALELCYSMSQMLRLDDPNHQMSSEDSLLLADWRISSPGDDPDEVKARLKYWAQTVACTLRLCS